MEHWKLDIRVKFRRELLDKLLPVLTGLVGSALGYYFGSKSSNA
jgi:hypothetical protein